MALTKAHSRMLENVVTAVNVKDYGAVGDGITDDTAAIQAANAIGKQLFFSGKFKVTAPIVLSFKPVVADGSFTVTSCISGVPFSSNGVTADVIGFKQSTSYSVVSSAPYMTDISIAANELSSMSSSTPGSDSFGSYYQLATTGTSRSNEINITNTEGFFIRVGYNGRHIPRLAIEYKNAAGAYLSTSRLNWYGGGAQDQLIPTDKIVYVLAYVSQDNINASAAKMQFVVETSDFSPTTNKGDVKIYHVDIIEKNEIQNYVPISSFGLPLKGVSKQAVQDDISWLNNSFSFSEIWQDLKNQAEYYRASGVRIQLHLDSGMNKGGGIYTGSFSDNCVTNLNQFFIACDLLGLKCIVCVFGPQNGVNYTYTMDQDSQTNTAKSDGYVSALEDLIDQIDKFESVVAYDLVNEAAYMLAADSSTTYTYAQHAALMDKLATACRAATSKPIIYSMADGYHGPQGWYYLDESLYDCVDSHGYYRPFRTYGLRGIDKLKIVGEIAHSSGASTDSQKVGELTQGYAEGKNNASACWFWERLGRYYDSGSVIVVNAATAEKYANLM